MRARCGRADVGHVELLRDGEQSRLHVVHLREHRLTTLLEPAEHAVGLLARPLELGRALGTRLLGVGLRVEPDLVRLDAGIVEELRGLGRAFAISACASVSAACSTVANRLLSCS